MWEFSVGDVGNQKGKTMNALTPINEIESTKTPVVRMEGDSVFANSLDVASFFGKRHANVIRDINGLMATNSKLSSLFIPARYLDTKGESRPSFDMTRDAFTVLAMGFTGKRAVSFKLAYIDAFNRMEQELRRREPETPNFSNPAEAARAWAEEWERRQIAQQAVAKLEPTAAIGKLMSSHKRSIMDTAGRLPGVNRIKVQKRLCELGYL